MIDFFSVTSPGNKSPPVICGTNTGYHSKQPFKNKVTLGHFPDSPCDILLSKNSKTLYSFSNDMNEKETAFQILCFISIIFVAIRIKKKLM